MAELNPPQLEAVFTLRGPLLVLAGAGTGKTRVVTFRIANLIRHGVKPDRILAVTFTNKAAREMQERIAEKLGQHTKSKRGQQATAKPLVGTFHSICVRILKRHARVLGYPEAFAIYDRSDQESLARSVLRELRIQDTLLSPGDFLSIVGRWKNNAIRPGQALSMARSDKEHLASAGYARYQKALKLRGAFDFDDLLLATESLLVEEPSIREKEAGLFDQVLVDEYQDTNGCQYRIIRALTERHRNLCVVGDDDQSIYGWRGAEVQHILNFRKDWPDAKVVFLEDNYRSTDAIIQAANRLIVFNRYRHDKVLRAARPNGLSPRVIALNDEIEEARIVAQDIQSRLADNRLQLRDFAILFRTNEQPRVFETELRRLRLPYTLTGSQSFFDRKEVRDILAFLRWIAVPSDEVSLLRVINLPPRGLGAKAVEVMLNEAVRAGQSLWDVVATHTPDLLNPTARHGLEQLRQLHRGYRQRFENSEDLVVIVKDLIAELRYVAEIERLFDDPQEQEMRKGNVEELVNAVAAYQAESYRQKPSLDGFLSSVTLEGREFGSPKEQHKTRNAISLMTLHSAKGLEFPIVYLVGMEEGILPHKRSLADGEAGVDEERRLCYVGITRAMEELTLTLSNSRFKYGKPRPTFASRFLYELTGQADHPNKLKSIRASREEAKKVRATKALEKTSQKAIKPKLDASRRKSSS